MPKDIFSKIIKDYNNELEVILEQKAFSSDVKNLLLSMLYKIENAYEDYKKVKVNVCSKKQFVKEILETIEKRCEEIEIIKMTGKEGQELYEKNINCIVDKEKGKIQTFQNEKSILEAIMKMRQEKIEISVRKYELMEEPIIQTLLIGNKENSLELITNFNGWSWDITKLEFRKQIYNKLYQMLIILIGNKGIENWINNRKEENEIEEIPSNVILSSKYNESFGITKEEIQGEKIDHVQKIINKFIENYGEELNEKFFKSFIKVAILNTANYNKEYKQKVEEKIQDLKKELKSMSNKVFIENLSLQKKQITKQIKEIDTILNDEIKLRKEYEKRNSKLPNKEKIFSTSHLKLMLEKQRNKKIEQIKEINKKMEPQQYVKIKNQLEEKLNFYKEIHIEENTKENVLRLQNKLEKSFLECFSKKIEKAKEKSEIEKLIYELRYYKKISPIVELEKEKKYVQKELTRKSMQRKNANKTK